MTRTSRGFRRAVGVFLLVFIAWLLLANHVILVTGEPAIIILSKGSWTFDECVLVEQEWIDFSFQYPMLSSRLVAGEGLWILGDGR